MQAGLCLDTLIGAPVEVRPKRSSTATAHAANDRMSDDSDGDDDHRVGGNMGVRKNMIA